MGFAAKIRDATMTTHARGQPQEHRRMPMLALVTDNAILLGMAHNASSKRGIQQPHEQAAALETRKVYDDNQSNWEVSSSA